MPPDYEYASSLLHHIFPSQVTRVFHFRFRVVILVLLVREVLRFAAGRWMGQAAGRRSVPIICHLWGGLGVIFKLRTVVVLLTSHAAGDAGQLVRLPLLRD